MREVIDSFVRENLGKYGSHSRSEELEEQHIDWKYVRFKEGWKEKRLCPMFFYRVLVKQHKVNSSGVWCENVDNAAPESSALPDRLENAGV